MLDTCVVRPVLVPAFLALVERSWSAGPPDEADDAEATSPDLTQQPSATRS